MNLPNTGFKGLHFPGPVLPQQGDVSDILLADRFAACGRPEGHWCALALRVEIGFGCELVTNSVLVCNRSSGLKRCNCGSSPSFTLHYGIVSFNVHCLMSVVFIILRVCVWQEAGDVF